MKIQRESVLERTARENGMSVEECRREMEAAIEIAMQSTDPVKQANFKRLFGDKKPTVEEFVGIIAREAVKKRK